MLPFTKKGREHGVETKAAYVEVSSSESSGSCSPPHPASPSASSSSASLPASEGSDSGTSAWTAGSSGDDVSSPGADAPLGGRVEVTELATATERLAVPVAGTSLPPSGLPQQLRRPPLDRKRSTSSSSSLGSSPAPPGASLSQSTLPLSWDAVCQTADGTPHDNRGGSAGSSSRLLPQSLMEEWPRPSPPPPPRLPRRKAPSAGVSLLELLPPVGATPSAGDDWDRPSPPPPPDVPLAQEAGAGVPLLEMKPGVETSVLATTDAAAAAAAVMSPPSPSPPRTESPARPSSTKAGSYSIGGGFRKGWKALKKGGLAMGGPRAMGSMVRGRRTSPAPLPILPGDSAGDSSQSGAAAPSGEDAGTNGLRYSRSSSPAPRGAAEPAPAADADDAAGRLAASLEIERKQARLTTAWQTEILSSWPKRRASRRVRDLVFQGVPASVRGRVWPLALGNSLDISVQLFNILKEQAASGREEYLRSRDASNLAAVSVAATDVRGPSSGPVIPPAVESNDRKDASDTLCDGDSERSAVTPTPGVPPTSAQAVTTSGSALPTAGEPCLAVRLEVPNRSLVVNDEPSRPRPRASPSPSNTEALLSRERSAHKAIMLDLPRTFPDLAFFHQPGSAFEGSLREILEAFAYLRPDIGYSQGMSFLGAVLLLYLDTPDAFACFVNMLHQSCFLHFFRMKMPEVRLYMRVHERLLREALPELAAHLRSEQVEPEMYLVNWVMALYLRALPLEHATRIWDAYMLDGDVVIFRAALGILKLLSPRLLSMPFEDCAYLLSHLPADEMDPDMLMDSVRSVTNCTRTHFAEVFRSCEEEHAASESAAATSKSCTAVISPDAGGRRDDGLLAVGKDAAAGSSSAGSGGTGGSGGGALGSATKATRALRSGGYRYGYAFGASRKTPLALSTKLSSSGSVTRAADLGVPPRGDAGAAASLAGDEGGACALAAATALDGPSGPVSTRPAKHNRSVSAGPPTRYNELADEQEEEAPSAVMTISSDALVDRSAAV